MGSPLRIAVIVLIFTQFLSSPLHASNTVSDITDRGYLLCGVRGNLAGFSAINDSGDWSGLDVETCQAIAAAVLKDKESVEFIRINATSRFPALERGEIDVLARNTTWTFSRDTGMSIDFTGVTFYDGQGFMAHKALGISSIVNVEAGTSVCVQKNTTTLSNLQDYVLENNLDIEIREFASAEIAETALFSRRCDIYTSDRSALAAVRAAEAPNPEDYIFFSDVISKEPLGPVIRDDDSRWREIVRWVIFALVQAEELGINSSNIETKKNSGSIAARFLLGGVSGIGSSLDLDDGWVYRVISQVGNYGEIFDRNFGASTRLNLERGLNKLWTDGGLLYSPPMR